MRKHILRVLGQWAVFTVLLAAVLFAVAGTTHLVFLRAYIGVFSIILLPNALLLDPGLSKERLDPGGKDKGERLVIGLLFLATIGLASADAGRLNLPGHVPAALSIIALVAFAAALSFDTWAMVVNPFFSSAVRIQTDRGQHLITRGPYRWLRHPGYFAMIVGVPASALAIGSWLALMPAAGFCLVITRRAWREDKLLTENLPGYREYKQRIRGALFPRLTTLRARQDL